MVLTELIILGVASKARNISFLVPIAAPINKLVSDIKEGITSNTKEMIRWI